MPAPENWGPDQASYCEESSYPSFREIEVSGPKGVVAKVFGRTRKDLEKRAALVAAAPLMLAACEAAIAYDTAIRKRVVNGEVNIMDTGGGVAMGDDLDKLYDAWAATARAALAKARAR